MNKGLAFGAGIGLGSGIMFLLDPDRGKRRRAMLRDKCVWAARKTGEGMGVTARDLSNRTHGIVSGLQSRFSAEPVDDSVLVDRVRSMLGRVVSHPSAIEVGVLEGKVTLAGPILANEVADLLAATKRVSGVSDVINNLEVHERADNHPSLQGGRERFGKQLAFMQQNWSPAARFIAGAAGASLAVYGGARRDTLGAGLGTAGLLLLARGITNADLRHLAGLGSDKGESKQKQLATGH